MYLKPFNEAEKNIEPCNKLCFNFVCSCIKKRGSVCLEWSSVIWMSLVES